jgi:hypothetical protein
VYTDGLSEMEVKSRLGALADTIDSRGWVIKNSALNLSAAPNYAGQVTDSSDRLVDYGTMPQPVPDDTILPSEDMLDEQNNPIAQQFDQLLGDSAKKRRGQLVDKLRGKKPTEDASTKTTAADQPQNDYWFMNQPDGASAKPMSVAPTDDVVFATPHRVSPGNDTASESDGLTDQERAVLDAAHKQFDPRSDSTAHLKSIDPNGPKPVAAPDPITLDLARNDDLDVATIARQAKKARDQDSDGEVVISLH